jgi:hypothetical protein
LLGFLPDKITVDGIERDACIAIDDNMQSAGGRKEYNGFAAVVPAVLLR